MSKEISTLAMQPLACNVYHARSWDEHVYVIINDKLAGWARVGCCGVGVAAGAISSDSKAWVAYDSYDPNWQNGAGLFQGVKLASSGGSF